MKKSALLLLVVLPVIACTKENGGTEGDGNSSKTNYTISFSDSVIGEEQDIQLSTDFKSDNPNILVTWFDNGERLNKLARSHTDYLWTAGKAGDHTITCSITDREEIIEFETSVKVIPCDYDRAIIGDSKEKIVRTYGDPKYSRGNTLGYGYGSGDVREFTFASDALQSIHFEKHYSWPSVNPFPHLGLLFLYLEKVSEFSEKYGTPTDQSEMGSTQAEKEDFAQRVYNSGALHAEWKYGKVEIILMVMRSSIYKPGYYYTVEVK